MKKYRVTAESTQTLFVDVEAESKEQAFEIANAIDGGDFQSYNDGDWNIVDCIELP